MVYIHINTNNINNTLNKDSLHKLQSYLYKKSEHIILTTDTKEEYKISQNNIYYKENTLRPNRQIYNYKHDKMKNAYEFIIDFNDVIYIPVFSQLPVQHSLSNITHLQYKMSKKSPISFIIEGSYCKDKDKDKEFCDKIQISNTAANFIPTNIYFQCSKNDFHLETPFFREELNVFLSLLN